MYKIVRSYRDPKRGRRTLQTGVTLEQAQAHCRDPETSSRTCKNPENRRRTRLMGTWFDCYEECRR
jgi:hypothetical protein